MSMSDDGLELNLDVGDPEVISGEVPDISDAIPEDEAPENVDKTPIEEDGDQPTPPANIMEYGELPLEDPYA